MGMHINKTGRQYQTLRIDRLCRVTHCDADFRDTPLTDREFAQKRWCATAIMMLALMIFTSFMSLSTSVAS